MARIPTITTVGGKPWRVLQGPGAIKVGAATGNDPGGVHATLASVGLTEGNITWNPNIEVAMLTSDQMFNPHGAVETAWAHQLAFSLDQSDIWNLVLAMSYDQDAVTSSSMVSLDGYKPSPYRSIRVETEGAKDTADGAQITQYLDFWKSKVIGGEVSFGRTAKTTVPVTVHGIANSSDVVGALSVTGTVTKPDYE